MAQDREEIRRNFNEAMSSGQTKVEIIEADERYPRPTGTGWSILPSFDNVRGTGGKL